MLELVLAGIVLAAFGCAAVYHAFRRDQRRGFIRPFDADAIVGLFLIALGLGIAVGAGAYWASQLT